MGVVTTMLVLAAAACFLIGLKMLGKEDTARRGNLLSAIGMGLAVLATGAEIIAAQAALGEEAIGPGRMILVLVGILLGGAVGVPAARLVKMTAMPEMVAIFNGTGGVASLFIAWSQLHKAWAIADENGRTVVEELVRLSGGADGRFTALTVFVAALVGGVTFTGSLIAFGKLSERLPSKPLVYANQHFVNAALGVLTLVCGVLVVAFPGWYWVFLLALVLALVLGVVLVIPIGGADMPVVISLLNSYSGLAACAAGFAVGNLLLVVTGSLVGASGLILTRVMCLAMNRSLANVLFSGFGSSGGGASAGPGEKREANSSSPEEAFFVLEAARRVVFVPGYGMAVAQAQHAVRELATLLEENGCDVSFAIHPVAGRMPGHMNVLLAEANVPYEQLVEMDDINPSMDSVDVAVVIGANDVVNPSARDDPKSAIAGMPIIEVDRARTVFILKRSMGSGFAGVENPLFFLENSSMVFGDAKKTIEALVGEFKSD